ncbi:GNAT family N-acetyltransferase [Chengkuizengella axinellae]|uniref:GNAT family protein n=1 Tax=Chengkuizengella axinellae TaxID=3064388 RepID=A0ABT9J3E5_9BACL|nr:GNAT family protein [Chengkuizengella sp. 2205SS18-9]MDP5275998.1 GNAT family protein [Chengkuizengella sp. 2205SS18-9]
MHNSNNDVFIIETNRLIIREFNESDLNELYTFTRQNDFMIHFSKKEDLKRYNKYLKEKHNQFKPDDTRFVVGLFQKDTAKLVGWSAIIANPEIKSTQRERMDFISKDQRNKGYVTEANKAIYDYVFNKSNHHEIVTIAYLANPYYELVVKMMKKNGYVPTHSKKLRNNLKCNYFILTKERYMNREKNVL